jgi:hypothetical protein
MGQPLYKVTITIWSREDLTGARLETITAEAVGGSATCSAIKSVKVPEPKTDPDWDEGVRSFFDDQLDETVQEDE